MNQIQAERLLCICYCLAAICGVVESITSGVTWAHWKLTLDQCVGRNCSCPLYGENTPTYFLGGSISVCVWISAGPIPIVLIFGVFGVYHGIRSCFGVKTEASRSVMTKNQSGEVIHMQIRTAEIEPFSRIFWITGSVVTSIFTIYQLAHFSTFADGYLHSCHQYRRELIKLLHLSGTAVDVVHSRLSCNAVFDFMDYLQPSSQYYIREGFINTAAALISGIIASFAAFIALGVSSYVNIKFARKQDV